MAENIVMEKRMSKLEGKVEEQSKVFESINIKLANMDRRFDDLDKKIDRSREELDRKIDAKVDGLREEMDRKIENLDKKIGTNFRWLVAIQFTTWITVLMAILLKS